MVGGLSIVVQPSDSAAVKFIWAQKRLAELEDLLRAFNKDNPNPASLDPDASDGAKQVYRCNSVPLLPPEVPLMVGEILYGFRSALDCAVYAISARKDPDFRSGFPIFLHPAPNWQGAGNERGFDPDGLRKIRLLPCEAQEIIKRYQPYDNHPTPASAPVWWLQELRNIDEHRTILLASAVVKTKTLSARSEVDEHVPAPLTWTNWGFKEGDVVVSITLRSKTKFEPHFATEVLLREPGEFVNRELPFLLRSIRDKVRGAIDDLQSFI
jgi:hypothetical protein